MADDSFYLPVDDRRQATRFSKEPGTEYVVLAGPAGHQQTAEVQNESLGGMAVLVPPGVDWPVGTTLSVCYAGDMLHAIVRHTDLLPDGRLRLGLECRDSSATPQS